MSETRVADHYFACAALDGENSRANTSMSLKTAPTSASRVVVLSNGRLAAFAYCDRLTARFGLRVSNSVATLDEMTFRC